MIDIHCHILPGMDDGPGSLEEALGMCRDAAADGIRTIVATPHFRSGIYNFTHQKILDSVAILQKALAREGIDLRIIPGAELAFSPELSDDLDKKQWLTINNNGRYFLVEFSPQSVPANWDGFLLSLLDSGKVPIIAHPERNAWFMGHPDALSAAVARGVMVQITAMSIVGWSGQEVMDFSLFLLENNLVHAIASDGHSRDHRPPLLSGAFRNAAELVGRAKAKELVSTIPRIIIEGGKCPALAHPAISTPKKEQKGRWFKRLLQ